jgi:multisubunit Na+/H+ antiporter MnhB subunit
MITLGLMFFAIKFYIEVKERLIYQNADLIPAYSIFSRKEQKDYRLNNHEAMYRNSILSYLMVPGILYFSINAVFYGAQAPGHKQLCFISIVLAVCTITYFVRLNRKWT